MEATATVRFNVGGTGYEVSRSLLEQHPDTMMAKMASTRWQQEGNTNEPLFIEGDGERFRHVLDYMRRGKVCLPFNNSRVSKTTLLEDLDYYGFANVASDAIQVEQAAVMESMDYLLQFEADCKAAQRHHEAAQRYHEDYIVCMKVAYHCYQRYKNNGSLVCYDGKAEFGDIATTACRKDNRAVLNECLGKFGLKVKSANGGFVEYLFGQT